LSPVNCNYPDRFFIPDQLLHPVFIDIIHFPGFKLCLFKPVEHAPAIGAGAAGAEEGDEFVPVGLCYGLKCQMFGYFGFHYSGN